MSAAPASSRICLRLARPPHGCAPAAAFRSCRPVPPRGGLHHGVRPVASLAAVTERTQHGAVAPWRGGLSRRALAALAAVATLAAAAAALALSHGSSSPPHPAPAKAAPARQAQPRRSNPTTTGARASKAETAGAARRPAPAADTPSSAAAP